MAKYYCILFDADNTLLDFDAAERKALAETLAQYNIEPSNETVEKYRTINEGLWRLSTHPDLMPGNVLDVLHELAEVATMAIVTNGFDKVQSRRVKESGIAAFMEEVFVSERSDSEKPNRKIFDTALRTLGVENREHVLVVGDSLSSDIQGGINAGLDTCWLNRNHVENPGPISPTYEIESLEQLYPIVMEPDELARVGMKNRRHQV